MFVTTGAYAKAGIEQVKTSPNYVALDGKDCLKVMTLFLEIDLKDQERAWYHNELKHGQITHDLAQFIEKEIAFLKGIKEIGQAPRMVLLSKNGLHFHFSLSLVSGWSHEGIQYLLDLPTQVQEQFCLDAGISSIGAIEPQYFDGKESHWIRFWGAGQFQICCAAAFIDHRGVGGIFPHHVSTHRQPECGGHGLHSDSVTDRVDRRRGHAQWSVCGCRLLS